MILSLFCASFVSLAFSLSGEVSLEGSVQETVPKIYTVGEPILSLKCRALSIPEILHSVEVKAATEVAHRALADFRQKKGFGRAIAAPQVGFDMSFVAINLGVPETMFNPEIIYRSSHVFSMWDDCLSFPDLMVRVERHDSISVRFIDMQGQEQFWHNCSRSISELLQHEIDHLNGILALDRKTDPPQEAGIPGIVDRTDWERNKEKYNEFVDYTIN